MSGKGVHSRPKKIFLLCLFCFILAFIFANMTKHNIMQNENNKMDEDSRLQYEEDAPKNTKHKEEITLEQSNPEPEFFLGIYGDRIAVYSRRSTGEVILEEVLPYPVKNVYYDELTRGIPFLNQEEKLSLLENLTS